MGEALSHAVLEGLHRQLLQVHPGAHVVADAILQDVPHCQHLHASPWCLLRSPCAHWLLLEGVYT